MDNCLLVVLNAGCEWFMACFVYLCTSSSSTTDNKNELDYLTEEYTSLCREIEARQKEMFASLAQFEQETHHAVDQLKPNPGFFSQPQLNPSIESQDRKKILGELASLLATYPTLDQSKQCNPTEMRLHLAALREHQLTVELVFTRYFESADAVLQKRR